MLALLSAMTCASGVLCIESHLTWLWATPAPGNASVRLLQWGPHLQEVYLAVAECCLFSSSVIFRHSLAGSAAGGAR